jgi:hypothetical protein
MKKLCKGFWRSLCDVASQMYGPWLVGFKVGCEALSRDMDRRIAESHARRRREQLLDR